MCVVCRRVDASDEDDLLEIRARDEEERYFDLEPFGNCPTTTDLGHCALTRENQMCCGGTGKRAMDEGEEECSRQGGQQETAVGGETVIVNETEVTADGQGGEQQGDDSMELG